MVSGRVRPQHRTVTSIEEARRHHGVHLGRNAQAGDDREQVYPRTDVGHLERPANHGVRVEPPAQGFQGVGGKPVRPDIPKDLILAAQFLGPGPGLGLDQDLDENPGGVFGDIAFGLGAELDESDRTEAIKVDAERIPVETAEGPRNERDIDKDDSGSFQGLLLPLGLF